MKGDIMAKCNVISHRGANKYAPQNTMPAFRKSIELGIDGFETDVHFSADGYIVICHNYTVDETSNGMGNVADMTLERLRELDFGSYFSDEFKGTQLPTLKEFLDLCQDDSVKVMNIEIKEPKDGKKDIADKTIEEVKANGLFDKLLISSFDPEIIKRCKEVDPACKTGFLYSPDRPITYTKMLLSYVEYAKELGADYLHPHFSLVNAKYVAKLHENGIGVNPWTVDDADTANRLLSYGVDGIITNVPDVMNKIIADYEYKNSI
jgi:glycerophosphoryl diester phosphodiesterase